MQLPIKQVEQMLDEIADTLPEELFRELNGGVLLLPEAKRSTVPGAEDLFILGEYCRDSMGRYVVLYYGSFCALYGHDRESVWRRELRQTLLHELTHHMESLAGLRDLEEKDEMEIEEYLSGWDEDEYEDEEEIVADHGGNEGGGKKKPR